VVDVFDQVEEELRSDRYKRWARTWLPPIIGVLLLALAAALAFWGWQSWQTSKADKASLAYERGLESLQANNPTTARAAFIQAAKEGNSAYRSLALQQQAGIALAEDHADQALKLLDEAAKASRDPLLSDPAALKAAWMAMDAGASLDDIEGRLKPLIGDKRPLAAYANYTLALARLQHGKTAEARDLLVVLKNGLDTPDDISQMSAAALSQIDAGTIANLPRIVDAMRRLPPPPAAAPAGPAAAPAAQAPRP
jgi:hypothetical protein